MGTAFPLSLPIPLDQKTALAKSKRKLFKNFKDLQRSYRK